MLNEAKLRECGVYVYTDMCDESDLFQSRPDGSQHTVIRYIGMTLESFQRRFNWHKNNSKFAWTWWEIIRVSRDYSHFVTALEALLLTRFHPSAEAGNVTSRKRRREKYSVNMYMSMPEKSVDLSWFDSSKFDETTDKPSELHKRYFQNCGIELGKRRGHSYSRKISDPNFS
jgi:hypothetical protein